ncbi:MAG: prolyl oligopeptidase family serine peptidase, partial [Lentisphaeria bacterium]|nr:prolyl oligopeptidase family serine peptidase [Lentisphaeria bacterium]
MKCSVRMIAIAVCAIAASQAYAQFPGGGAPQGQQQSQTEKWQKILKETELEQKPFTKGEDKLNICQHLYNKDQAGKPAILVFLHGIGERGDNNLAQNELGVSDIVKNIRDQKQKVVLITCQCPSSELWAPLHRGGSGAALQPLPSKSTGLIPDMIEAKIKEFDADPDRVYITGLSMGGYGTWDTISRRPDLFAAAIPICGGADPAQAPVLKNMAISIFHGDRDNLVPTNLSREMFKALEDAGNKNVKLTIYEGVEHNSWEKAYADPETFKWLFAQKRTEEGKKAKGKVFTEEEIARAQQGGGGMFGGMFGGMGGGMPNFGGMGGGMPNFGGMGGGMPPMGGGQGGMPDFGAMFGGGMPPMGGGQGGMPDFGAMFGGGMPPMGGQGGAPGGAPGGQGGFPGFGG